MDHRLEKVIFICCCLAGTVNCFPIPAAQIGEQKALIFGVLAFISVGAVLGACVCCRRRKRGFELNQIKDRKEFENESGVLEPARTEYPIFRAISSPERSSPQNEPINQVANAHIIGINENIIEINEEINDNNNGPLSPADMENIENNNAVDYIPNRNETERLVEPVAISIQHEEEQQQPFLDRSNPFTVQTRNYDVAYSNNPFVGINENVVVEVEYCGNRLEVIGLDDTIKPTVKLLDEAISLESSLSDKSVTDVNSVEEALRALDIAISGEESFLQQNDDEFECFVTNEDNKFAPTDLAINDETNEMNDKTTSLHDQSHIDAVRKEAESLVDSVLEESKSKISQSLVPTNFTLSQTYNDFVQDCLIEFNELQVKADDANLKQEYGVKGTELNDQYLTRDLQSTESIENLCFENIALEASTPFVRKFSKHAANERPAYDSPILTNATFDIVPDSSKVFDSPTVEMKKIEDDLGISPLVSETQESRLSSGMTNVNGTFVKNENTEADQSRPTTQSIESPLANATFDMDKEPIGVNRTLNDTRQLDKTFPLDKPNPANSTYTSSSEPFLKDAEIDPQIKCPIIKIDREDSTSVDMTTVTPVNTPIELNYSLDSWDKFISNSMSQELVMPRDHVMDMQQPCTSAQAAFAEAGSSGWFLHSKNDDPPSASETFDVDYESEEDMNETFDALRKQLIIMLPHAQGVTEHPPDFSDDDDDDDDIEEKPEQRSPCENISEPHTEMIINYKRPLSPIMEESEDETCKTFVMNETKNLDSTSTGCIETGEAIMGVTKTLMASNDTLFNFEDTFGDDVFSPRTTSQNDIVKDTTKAGHPDSSGASTPTPRSFKPMEFETNEVCNVNDLLSPDQQKTLSEDICTVDHLSSDAVDTTFTTNTLDEKTCISVHIKEDEKISEISEPDWGSSGQFDLNSLNDVPSMGIMENEDDEQSQCNEFENDESSSTVDIPKKEEEKAEQDNPNTRTLPSHQHNGDDESYKDKTTNFLRNEINYSAGHYNHNKSSGIKSIIYDNVKENTDPNAKQCDRMEVPIKGDDMNLFAKNLTESGIFEGDLLNETDVIMQNSTFHPIDLNKHHEIIPNFTLCEITNQGDQNCVMVATEMINNLSGEEDPWAHPISDIRFTGPCTEIMSTSFTANEWDSDVDDSNSSEEFMYVKGTPPKVPSPELYKHKLEHKHDSGAVPVIVEESSESVWKSHEDKVPVTEVADADHEQYEDEEDSSSDAEGEWVPSCWDSLAQPSRSALKSPDKSSSEEDIVGSPKKRRSVAFKKQNYHSVYEYPKEVASLSPSYSEPQLWDRDLTDLFEKSSETIDDKVATTENDGFSVSSSTRPFHGSQFNAQCHTWPTESNFSWSQIQDNESHNDKYPSYSDLQIKWPKDLKDFICTEHSNVNIDKDMGRPDSGVGESAELLSDSVTLGDLCHTKASLRLPLHNVPALLTTGMEVAKKNSLTDPINAMLPTPSCTGSMDSLTSSGSGSERQMSFSTFGKSASLSDDRINERDRKESSVGDEEEKLHNSEVIQVDSDRSTKQSDSTDEDSGIESIMRIASEKI